MYVGSIELVYILIKILPKPLQVMDILNKMSKAMFKLMGVSPCRSGENAWFQKFKVLAACQSAIIFVLILIKTNQFIHHICFNDMGLF